MPPRDAPKPADTPARGFGRDIEMERDRGEGRPASGEMNSTEKKADQAPILGQAPDPDVYPAPPEPIR